MYIFYSLYCKALQKYIYIHTGRLMYILVFLWKWVSVKNLKVKVTCEYVNVSRRHIPSQVKNDEKLWKMMKNEFITCIPYVIKWLGSGQRHPLWLTRKMTIAFYRAVSGNPMIVMKCVWKPHPRPRGKTQTAWGARAQSGQTLVRWDIKPLVGVVWRGCDWRRVFSAFFVIRGGKPSCSRRASSEWIQKYTCTCTGTSVLDCLYIVFMWPSWLINVPGKLVRAIRNNNNT
jgi:hypothetical protein